MIDMKWVSVNEDFPKRDQCVDVWFSHGDYDGRLTDCFYDHVHYSWWYWDAQEKVILPSYVTHWMPLPPSPEINNEGE